jgi:hypothetical protein
MRYATAAAFRMALEEYIGRLHRVNDWRLRDCENGLHSKGSSNVSKLPPIALVRVSLHRERADRCIVNTRIAPS